MPLNQVIIVGAGPSGCLLALLLSKIPNPPQIDIYEYRQDIRDKPATNSKLQRSINLALSTRGLTALEKVGLREKVESLAVPMHGRCIHIQSKPLQFHPYGQADQALLSVSRKLLTCELLNACQSSQGIRLHFNSKCISIDFHQPSATFQPFCPSGAAGDSFTQEADLIVGADGVFSRVRSSMAHIPGFNFSQMYVDAAYKELTMLNTSSDGSSAFPPSWLHIWPRHRFMLIALPNDSHSFTCTLFMDKSEFDALKDESAIQDFFSDNFPDALAVMPSLVHDFTNNPAPSLVTIRCNPYNYKGNVVLVGDAAHAIVPFYGQGCNAAFEGCRLLAEAIETRAEYTLEQALTHYAKDRKPNADAIADLALNQYEDMSSKSASSFFVMRRRMEIAVNRFFPKSFLPLYSMISFSNIPYADAVQRAIWQNKKIDQGFALLGAAVFSSVTILTFQRFWKTRA